MPKARKKHVCTLCFETILKGEDYIYHTITIWEHYNNGMFGVYKVHKACDKLWLNGAGRDMDWILPVDKYEWQENNGGN